MEIDRDARADPTELKGRPLVTAADSALALTSAMNEDPIKQMGFPDSGKLPHNGSA